MPTQVGFLGHRGAGWRMDQEGRQGTLPWALSNHTIPRKLLLGDQRMTGEGVGVRGP